MGDRNTTARNRAFEARLAELQQRLEAGFAQRAAKLRQAADRLERGEAGARQDIGTYSHRLRGIAGSYGHAEVTDAAGVLEQCASTAPVDRVTDLARALADRVERIARRSGADATTRQPSLPGPSLEPRAASAPTSHPGVSSPAANPEPRAPLRVLAVDDDPLTLRLLSLTLRQVGGFEATIVNSAAQALSQLSSASFDLVVSDAMMPDMNGLQFCEAARALRADLKRLPIVILSAATPEELGWRGRLDAGTTWLRKPFRPSALVAELSRIAAPNAQ